MAATNLPKQEVEQQLTEDQKLEQDEDKRELEVHMSQLGHTTVAHNDHDISNTPLFNKAMQKKHPELFTQYGLLASDSNKIASNSGPDVLPGSDQDPRIFFNIQSPSSAFICGSQGSGKSYTLSCLLENCLMKSNQSKLETPLAALVCHYDSFISDEGGSPCEAAYLASGAGIEVKVLCSPANLQAMKETYKSITGIKVEKFLIDQKDLNTERMLMLMGVGADTVPLPLYLQKIMQLLREDRIARQRSKMPFDYAKFKTKIDRFAKTNGQIAPLAQRLDLLKSCLAINAGKDAGANWNLQPGTLTIVDLSCPCVTSASACAFFSIGISLCLEKRDKKVGSIIALDEAHKYLTSTDDADKLTDTLLCSVRMQRHLGTRVFISTQEPTVSTALLSLCTITIVHRFSSPAWLQVLKSHLAGIDTSQRQDNGEKMKQDVFKEIVNLRTGEALCFAPTAMVGGGKEVEETLGAKYLKIKIRKRLTKDGGESVQALAIRSAGSNVTDRGD
ncbi:hypothetical protein BJ878DRAFT_557412 [Calycina marina]|uniref:Uncharacterized protein n=1 Tax=Calycina marina TaxID=1763456 RepID=A0A9P8CCL5_9HELO|nr:hypothetical protein BJ878DRAFT_557412 [Calycina marina]